MSAFRGKTDIALDIRQHLPRVGGFD